MAILDMSMIHVFVQVLEKNIKKIVNLQKYIEH